MARLPKNPAHAVEELGVSEGASVLAFGPANGYVEALGAAVGASGRLLVWDPPPELEAPGNAEIIEAVPDGASADVVLVWVGPVPAHAIREYPAHVSADGALWVVLPRRGKETRTLQHEADVKRALLVAGWRDDRVVPLATDAVAMRFRRRR